MPEDMNIAVEKVSRMIDHPDQRARMGKNARRVYEEKYTPDQNYEMLINIYNQAIEGHKSNDETNRSS